MIAILSLLEICRFCFVFFFLLVILCDTFIQQRLHSISDVQTCQCASTSVTTGAWTC